MAKEKEMKVIKNFSIQFRGKFGLICLLIGGILVISLYFSATDYDTMMIFTKSQVVKPLMNIDTSSKQLGNTTDKPSEPQEEEAKLPITCDFTTRRADTCEINDRVHIHGSSSQVFFCSDKTNTSEPNQNWRVRPYTRKGDDTMMLINEISVKVLSVKVLTQKLPHCKFNHTVPAVIFSTRGYSGNYWHDFNDILVPLFITARQFNGQVQLLATQMKSWYIHKYGKFLKGISKYEIMDFDKMDELHCFPKAIVGLHSHKDFSIDPFRAPNGDSMADFAKLMREVYELKRGFALNMKENLGVKPRIYIMPRKGKRALTNMEEIIPMAQELGFEVVVEGDDVGHTDLDEVSKVINSCDVMMGVHGAGFTNMVFLPRNAVVIQIIPLGKLDKLYHTEFGIPAIDMKLKYISYNISEEESSLIDKYPRDHAVFTDPMSIHKLGWTDLSRIFMMEQNVKLDVKRFTPILERAIKHLRGEDDF